MRLRTLLVCLQAAASQVVAAQGSSAVLQGPTPNSHQPTSFAIATRTRAGMPIANNTYQARFLTLYSCYDTDTHKDNGRNSP